MTTDTLGQIAVTTEDMGTTVLVVVDTGPHSGMRADLNGRTIETLEELPHLTLHDLPDREPYGRSWGGGTGLVAVTDAEVEALRELNATRAAAVRKRRAEEAAKWERINRGTRGWMRETAHGAELADHC